MAEVRGGRKLSAHGSWEGEREKGRVQGQENPPGALPSDPLPPVGPTSQELVQPPIGEPTDEV